MTERKLKVNIGANVGGALGGFKRVGDAGASMGSRVASGTRAAASGLAALAGGAVVAGAGAFKLAQNASDMNEGISRSNVVFGEGADLALDFGKTAATGYGMSKVAAAEATSSIGQLLTATGLVGDELAEASIDVAKFAGDLSSFANITTDEAIGKVFSGLAGEIEPLRRVGVAMDAAAVEAVALREGFAATKDELTQGDKTMARMILMMELGENIHGDFARTSDDLAQQQRTLSAQFENTKVALGEVFLPAMTTAITYLNDSMPDIQEKVKEALTDSIEKAGDAWDKWGPTVSEKAGQIKTALSEFFLLVKGQMPAVRERFERVFGIMKNLFVTLSPVVKSVAEILMPIWRSLGDLVLDVFDNQVLPAVERLTVWIADNLPEWKKKFSETFETIKTLAVDIYDVVWPKLVEWFQILWDKIVEVYNWVVDNWPAISDVLTGAWDAFVIVVEEVVGILESLWDTMLAFVDDLNEQWPTMVQDISDTFAEAWRLVEETIDAWKLGWEQFGEGITEGMVTVLIAAIRIVRGITRTLTGFMTFLQGAFSGDWGLVWEGIKEVFYGVFDAFDISFERIAEEWHESGGKLATSFKDGLVDGFYAAMRGIQTAYNATLGKIPGAPGWTGYIGPHEEQGRPSFGHEGNPNRGIFPNFDPVLPTGMVSSSIVSGRQQLGGHNSNAPSIVNFNNYSTTPTDVTGVAEMLAEAAAFSGGDNQSGQFVTTRSPF